MGNQSSNNGDGKEKDNISISNVEASNYYMDNLSSYKGMKTETGTEISGKSMKSDNASHTSDKATDQETTSLTEKKVPCRFEWKEGGKKVLLTGSFLNWNTFIEMNHNNNGLFEFNINLPKGIYQFKFIIDGTWRTSNFYPKVRDNSGNENNQIDITNYTEPEKKEDTKSVKTKPENTTKNTIKNDYNSYYPKKNEMNSDAPHTPFHYLKSFNINYNTRQNKIGKNKYLIYNEKNLLSENNSYKKVQICPHVNL